MTSPIGWVGLWGELIPAQPPPAPFVTVETGPSTIDARPIVCALPGTARAIRDPPGATAMSMASDTICNPLATGGGALPGVNTDTPGAAIPPQPFSPP